LIVPTPEKSELARQLWFDVEDLFEYAAGNPRPSGIQRLAYEIYFALQQTPGHGARIHFVRHDQVRKTFSTVPWPTIVRLFERLTDAPDRAQRHAPATMATGHASDIPAASHLRWLARRLVHRVPPGLRERLLVLARQQLLAWHALTNLLGYAAGRVPAVVRQTLRGCVASILRQVAPGPKGDFATLVQPGDFLVVLGSPWNYPDYAELITNVRSRVDLRFALLVFDLIPIRRPEWCDRGLVHTFRAWFTAILPLADVILAISQSTANDVERFAAQSRMPLRARAQVIPIGSGFGPMQQAPAIASAHIPRAGSYVLFVSTIEARKNHLLLFRVWRRLLEEMPPSAVPTLVFAGRVGWMGGDLMEQLENTNYLDRKICVLSTVSDSELASLYQGCLFTLFPSLYEGWGLPVTESLMFGKPCIVARSSSLPEAGGRFARYFDPESVSDAYGVIRTAIENPEELRAWQDEITRSFVPVPWTATADAILRHLGIG
jgi:glycosyltransferase involved in cell wall biosynthesis